MAEQGYDGATVQAVAAKAGLTPGLVHYHFKSKLEILLSLIDSIEGNVNRRFELRASAGADPEKDLEAFIYALLGLGKDSDPDGVRCWIVIGAEALRQSDVAAAYRGVTERQIATLEQIVSRCLKARGRKTRSKRAITLGVYAAIDGAFRLLISAPSLIEAGFAAPTVLAMAEGAIASAPKA